MIQLTAIVIFAFLFIRFLFPKTVYWLFFLLGRLVRKWKDRKKKSIAKQRLNLKEVKIPLTFEEKYKDILRELELPTILRKTKENKSFEDLFIR